MTVEHVLMPMGAVFGVGELCVEAHYCREELGDEEDDKSSDELGIEFEGQS